MLTDEQRFNLYANKLILSIMLRIITYINVSKE